MWHILYLDTKLHFEKCYLHLKYLQIGLERALCILFSVLNTEWQFSHLTPWRTTMNHKIKGNHGSKDAQTVTPDPQASVWSSQDEPRISYGVQKIPCLVDSAHGPIELWYPSTHSPAVRTQHIWQTCIHSFNTYGTLFLFSCLLWNFQLHVTRDSWQICF
jgi:hypothetical protein